MRALFVATPGAGHVFPMVPLAWALRALGHQVLVVTGTSAVRFSAEAGLPTVNANPDFDREAVLATMRREEPEWLHKMLHTRIDDIRAVTERFAMMARILLDGVVGIAKEWRPDVIVQSAVQGAGLVAAGKLDIPIVDHGFGFARTEGIHEMLGEHMKDMFARYAAPFPRDHEQFIDVAPPSMTGGATQGWSMRYVPYNGGAVLPGWLTEPPKRRRIAVSMGTMAPQTVGIEAVHKVLELAPEFDVEFVLAIGKTGRELLGELPANVIAEDWIPLDALLPSCVALIHHGGSGTALTPLAHGIPQVVLPNGADRHINAKAVHARGAGIETTPEELDAELLNAALDDPAIRAAAAEVRDEIAALPSPVEVANTLVDYVRFSVT